MFFRLYFFWLRRSNAIALVSANFTSTSWLLSCHLKTLFRGRVARNNVKLQNLDNGSTYKVDYRLISSFGRAPVCKLSWKSWVQTLAWTTLRVFKQLKRNSCPCKNICNLLDFLVFSDKEEKRKKREVPSHSTFTYLVFVGSKRTRHCSRRVGDVDTGGGVANVSWACWVDYPVRRDIRELKQSRFWATHVNRKWPFFIFWRRFRPNFQSNRLYNSKEAKEYKFYIVKAC